SSSLAFTTGIMESFLLLSDFEPVHPAVFEANLATTEGNPASALDHGSSYCCSLVGAEWPGRHTNSFLRRQGRHRQLPAPRSSPIQRNLRISFATPATIVDDGNLPVSLLRPF